MSFNAKLKSSFLLLVLFLSVTFWHACNCPSEHFFIRFDNPNVTITFVNNNLIERELYSNYLFDFEVSSAMVKFESPLNDQTQYASIGPFSCEVELKIDSVVNALDSVQVLTDKPYSDNNSNDVTSLFENESKHGLNMFMNGWVKGRYFLKVPPMKSDSFIFTFKFLTKKGAIMEFVSPKTLILK